MRIPDDFDPQYEAELRERCLKRVGWDPVKAERLVEAAKRGYAEADRNWRERAA